MSVGSRGLGSVNQLGKATRALSFLPLIIVMYTCTYHTHTGSQRWYLSLVVHQVQPQHSVDDGAIISISSAQYIMSRAERFRRRKCVPLVLIRTDKRCVCFVSAGANSCFASWCNSRAKRSTEHEHMLARYLRNCSITGGVFMHSKSSICQRWQIFPRKVAINMWEGAQNASL